MHGPTVQESEHQKTKTVEGEFLTEHQKTKTQKKFSMFDFDGMQPEPQATLTQEVDERALNYIKSLLRRQDKGKEELVRLGVPDPEKKIREMQMLAAGGVRNTVTYAVSEKTRPHANGELFPSRLWAKGCSAQSVYGPLRSMMLGEHTFDIDMSSCWMRILKAVINDLHKKGHNVTCVQLTDWLVNKKRYMEHWRVEKGWRSTKKAKENLSKLQSSATQQRTGFNPFQELQKEVKAIEAALQRIPELKKFREYVQRKTSTVTLVRAVTEAVEVKLIWNCVRELKEKHKVEVACVVHDGFHVYKSDAYTPEEICSICDQVCDELLPGSARFVMKPPCYDIFDENKEPTGKEWRVPDEDFQEEETLCNCGCGHTEGYILQHNGELIEKERCYASRKEEFEENHCQICDRYMDGEQDYPKFTYVTEDQLRRKCYGRVKFDRHKVIASGQGVEVTTESVNFFPVWNNDETKRYYRNWTCNPDVTQVPDDVFNTWCNFAVFHLQPSIDCFDEEVVHRFGFFLRHVHRLMNCEFRRFFYLWWSHLLSYPHKKVGIMIGLIGEKRIGKGQLIEMLMRQVGRQYSETTQHPEQNVWGTNGTNIIENCMLMHLKEVKPEAYKTADGHFRVLITDNRLEVKAMHQGARTIDNFTRFIHDGNNLALSGDEEERIAQDRMHEYWLKQSKKQFPNYFKELAESVDDPCVQLMVAAYLMQEYPSEPRISHLQKPKTVFASRNRELWVQGSIVSFLNYLCERFPWEKATVLLCNEELCKERKNWNVQEHRADDTPTQEKLMKDLAQFMAIHDSLVSKRREGPSKVTKYTFHLELIREHYEMTKPTRQFPQHDDETCNCALCSVNDKELLETYTQVGRELVDSFGNDPSGYLWRLQPLHKARMQQEEEERAAIEAQRAEEAEREAEWRRREQQKADEVAKRQREEEEEAEARRVRQKEYDDELRKKAGEEYEEWKKQEEEKLRREKEEREKANADEVQTALVKFPSNPNSACATDRQYGGGVCASVAKDQSCHCHEHGQRCACLQCRIRKGKA